jgi:two-component system alkaline phosphatase synthesis response regulator PhoP
MKKILIVDDEPNIVMSLEYLLRRKKFDVFIARNGTEALESLGKSKPDLVLLDIMMPDVDGYEICEYIKSTPDLKHIKVIFLSAKSKKSDIEKGLELGADLYMVKPFSNKELVQNINVLVDSPPSPLSA